MIVRGFEMALTLMYITNNLDVALIAQKYGVERIWIDLETIGKEKRQNGMNTVKSHHTITDIGRIKHHLKTSEMLVRINSWYEGSDKEIDDVIHAGADIIMLPYWKTTQEVESFIKAVDGRCATTLLLETKEAVDCIDRVLEIPGIDEIHIGLNDLHLSYELDFMFELLVNGTVEELCKKIATKGIAYSYKTNYTPKLVKIVDRLGGYAEVVSEMELEIATKAGVKPEKIIWNGPLKKASKVKDLLLAGGTVNIDSIYEIENIRTVAEENPEHNDYY